jgi:hypothetical protein
MAARGAARIAAPRFTQPWTLINVPSRATRTWSVRSRAIRRELLIQKLKARRSANACPTADPTSRRRRSAGFAVDQDGRRSDASRCYPGATHDPITGRLSRRRPPRPAHLAALRWRRSSAPPTGSSRRSPLSRPAFFGELRFSGCHTGSMAASCSSIRLQLRKLINVPARARFELSAWFRANRASFPIQTRRDADARRPHAGRRPYLTTATINVIRKWIEDERAMKTGRS